MKRNELALAPTGPGGALEIVYLYNGRTQAYIPMPQDITPANVEATRAALEFVEAYNKAQVDV